MPYTCLFILFASFLLCNCQYDNEKIFDTYTERRPYVRENEQFRQKRVPDYPNRQERVPDYPHEQNGRGRYNYRPEPVQDFTPSYRERNQYNPELPERQARMRSSGNMQNRDYLSPNRKDNYGKYRDKEDFSNKMGRVEEELYLYLAKRQQNVYPQRLIYLLDTYVECMQTVKEYFNLRDPYMESYVEMLWSVGGPRIIKLPMKLSTSDTYLNWNNRDSAWMIRRLEQIDELWYTVMYSYFRRFIWSRPLKKNNIEPGTDNRTAHDV